MSETPKGAPWPTVTAPSPLYLPQYKRWAKAKKVDPADELVKVITDTYFRQSLDGKDKDALTKARMLSWALTYYLAEEHLPQLFRYYQELAKLPRNLDFDEEVLKACFARAFDLEEEPGSGVLSDARVKKFAEKWHSTIKGLALEGETLFDKAHQLETEEPTKVAPGTGGQIPGMQGGGPNKGPGRGS